MKPFLPESIPLVIAPDGVDSDWLEQTISSVEARHELGLSDEKRSIAVYTGHLYQGRGIELIISLAKRMKDYLFLIVGGGENDIMRYRDQTVGVSNLRFEGFQSPSKVFLYLRAADVLMMPYGNRVQVSGGGDVSSFFSPIKMFEYMAAGRPILASRLSVLQEVLHDDSNALLLPYDEPQRWCDALIRLKNDSDFGERLASQAHSDVAQYTWKNRAERLLQETDVHEASR